MHNVIYVILSLVNLSSSPWLTAVINQTFGISIIVDGLDRHICSKLLLETWLYWNEFRIRYVTELQYFLGLGNLVKLSVKLLCVSNFQKAVYDRKAQLADYEKWEKTMQQLSYYPLFWKVKPLKGQKMFTSTVYNFYIQKYPKIYKILWIITGWEKHEQQALENAKKNPFPRCYLQLGTDTMSYGRVIIQLHAEKVPMTCENFRCLCTGETGPSYKCSNIHRIIPDVLWQGGDITGHDGLGTKSIYGENFADENFKLKHNKAGTVSMANNGPNTNGSQFIITARETCALDNTNVVFGKVIAGMSVLKRVNFYKKNLFYSRCWFSVR